MVFFKDHLEIINFAVQLYFVKWNHMIKSIGGKCKVQAFIHRYSRKYRYNIRYNIGYVVTEFLIVFAFCGLIYTMRNYDIGTAASAATMAFQGSRINNMQAISVYLCQPANMYAPHLCTEIQINGFVNSHAPP